MDSRSRFLNPDEEPDALKSLLTEKRPYVDDGRGVTITYNYDSHLSLDQQRQKLPVFRLRSHILYSVESNSTTIIIGETGSGKSTQVPQYLHEAGWTRGEKENKVVITQPRRVAAVTIANRVAEEKGWSIGKEVGYAIRFEECLSDDTQIKFATDGMLISEILRRDPMLSDYSVVMVDEAHERSLQTDLLLGLLKKIQKKRPALRLIVTSATLDAEKFRDYFSDNGKRKVGIVAVEGRQYPVDIHYSLNPLPCYLQGAKETVVSLHKQEPLPGDILVFVPGQEEVHRLVGELSDALRDVREPGQVRILPMHGSLPNKDQRRVLERTPRHLRKVVVATNVAETSLTIPGVVYVVDTGFAKIRAFNATTGLEALLVQTVSKAGAIQRAGRAGRIRSGKVYRLYTEEAFKDLPDASIPEMQRCDLSQTILQLKSLGVDNFVRFDFLSPPPARNMLRAVELLYALGAIDSQARLTSPVGSRMSEMGISPMAARMLLSSSELGCAREAAAIAALMQVRCVFISMPGRRLAAEEAHRAFVCKEGDHISQLNALLAFEQQLKNLGRQGARQWCDSQYLHFQALQRALQLRDRMLALLSRFRLSLNSCLASFSGALHDLAALQKALVSGFFAQAARLHPKGDHYRTVRGDHELHLHRSSVLFTSQTPPRWVVFTETILSDKEYMESVTEIQPEWLHQLAPHFYRFGTEREVAEQEMKMEVT